MPDQPPPPSDTPRRNHRGGAPQAVVTPEQRNLVTVLRANGVALKSIARVVGLSDKTVKRHCRAELEAAHEDLTARMGATLVRIALAGNVNALKFWLATRGGAGWRIPKDAVDAAATSALLNEADGAPDAVNFYMPSNGRDRPEEEEGPIIDGDAEEAA